MDSGAFQTIALGILPLFRKNGAYPVLSNLAELIANWIVGNFPTQSFWSGLMHCQSICPMVLFMCSIDPFIWGWYTLDIFNLVPISLCKCPQKRLVNNTSRLLMIFLGNPLICMSVPVRCSALKDTTKNTNWGAVQVFKGFPQLDIHNRKCRVMCEVMKGETATNAAVFAQWRWDDWIEVE